MGGHFDLGDPLLAHILGRSRSLFADDMEAHRAELADSIGGARILVVGAAGSIGGAFVKQLVAYGPTALHLVDLNENTMVEVVRELRSAPLRLPDDLRSVTVDFGSEEFFRFALDSGPYDMAFNFSAMKHVRSERDVYSLMRMIDVNVRALHAFLGSPAAASLRRAFSVSTDKSVRPVNLMGATKNLMERVLFAPAAQGRVSTSARFANVAFSAGSLLEGFEMRLAKNQAIAAPSDVKRYFISHEEAGQLCLLSGCLGQDREVFFPKMTASEDLMGFADIATAFLRQRGYEPLLCASEEEAKRTAPSGASWPCWFSHSDTTGEKAFEEFYRDDDVVDRARFGEIGVVREAVSDQAGLDGFLDAIARLRATTPWRKDDVVAAIRAAVPDLSHVELGRSLDQKM